MWEGCHCLLPVAPWILYAAYSAARERVRKEGGGGGGVVRGRRGKKEGVGGRRERE